MSYVADDGEGMQTYIEPDQMKMYKNAGYTIYKEVQVEVEDVDIEMKIAENDGIEEIKEDE